MEFILGPLFILETFLLLPLKDNRERQRGFPIATASLVALNVVIFVFMLWVLPGIVSDPEQFYGDLFENFAIVPINVLEQNGPGALSLVTAGFMHANIAHLMGNMIILWFFGRKVEDLTGPFRFLLFYLLCLLGAGITSAVGRHALSPIEATVPSIGASGAISGVMAAYLFLYASEQINTLVVFASIPIPYVFKWPAWVYIVYNFVHDLLLGLLTEELVKIYGASPIGVDVFAHAGGLIMGLIFIYLYLLPDALVDRRQHR
jgi:membrane associated rhomboid family serine protease